MKHRKPQQESEDITEVMEPTSSLIINQHQTALVGITIPLGEIITLIRAVRVMPAHINHIPLHTGHIEHHHTDRIVLQFTNHINSNTSNKTNKI